MVTEKFTISQLEPTEYAPYFQPIFDLVGSGCVVEQMREQQAEVKQLFASMPENDAAAIHPPYTWQIKEVLAHVIDAEKIFGCRAHRIACGDQTDLPGFDENAFVKNYDYSQTPIGDLLTEFDALRTLNHAFYRRVNQEAMVRIGTCNNMRISVRAIAILIVGHAAHHLRILHQRLAPSP